MEHIRVSAKTVADAIIEASIELGTSSDNIEYEVIEEGRTGFLGFGSRQAVIQAWKKVVEVAEPEVKPVEKPVQKEAKKEFVKEAVKEKEPVKEPVRQAAVKETAKAKVKEAVKEAVKEVPVEAEKEAEAPKKVKKASEAKAPIDKEEAIKRAEEFLKGTMAAMNMTVDVRASFDEEDTLNVEIDGDEMGVLIGKRGQTLDSIQYLTSLVVNKGKASYVRVKVDTEDYRRRRKETLENLARNIASKVRRTKKPVFLEPMNPYERRIIHSALQNNPYVSTHSEGEEPYRKVVVTLKK